MLVHTLLAIALATSAAAQSNSSSPTSASRTTTPLKTSATSALTSAASTAAPSPSPTANSTQGIGTSVQLWLPAELRQCEKVSLAFTAPPVPKTCGVFVTNTSTFIEQLPVGAAFTSLTTAVWDWVVDLPAGLSVNLQCYVSINGGSSQYTTAAMVVQQGQNTTCLARNSGQNTASIVSYASSILPSYVYSAPSSTAGATTGGPAVGAIAGGVVGGAVALTLLAFFVYFLRRRRTIAQRALTAQNLQMADKQNTEMPGYPPQMMYGSYQSSQLGLVRQPSSRFPEPVGTPSTPPPRTAGSPFSEFSPAPSNRLDDPSTFLDRSLSSPRQM